MAMNRTLSVTDAGVLDRMESIHLRGAFLRFCFRAAGAWSEFAESRRFDGELAPGRFN